MGDIQGFKKYHREVPGKRLVEDRVRDYLEIYEDIPEAKTVTQAARCMDCGVPFCHSGCPLGNIIPDFNDAVYREDWQEAFEILSETNNFPEFTGRICPAPCEASCVLGINSDAVTIEFIEKAIAEKAYELGYARPQYPLKARTGQRVAVVGSGPAGLAASEQLNKAGHEVTLFERNDEIGGLLRYGIPDFKLEKRVIDRRLELMEAAGVEFRTNANVGGNVSVESLRAEYDAIVLTGGSTVARDLPIAGRELEGVHFAMDFLEQQNRENNGRPRAGDKPLRATDKHVLVIGGGDTGADCVGTSNRQGATSVKQIELLTQPPNERAEQTPWPMWPMQLRTSTSHEEGCERSWAILTKEFVGDAEGKLRAVKLVDIEWTYDEATQRSSFTEVEGTEREIPCDLALLAVGFMHPQREGMLEQLGLELDGRGNVRTTDYQTSDAKVFAAGDMRRGQSLVVWAISEGRECAVAVDEWLTGAPSVLAEKEEGKLLVG